MRTKGFRLSIKDYYNLVARGTKRTPSEELQFALYTLESKGFKVRVKEKYVVNNNIKQSQEVEFFFYASPKPRPDSENPVDIEWAFSDHRALQIAFALNVRDV